MAFLPSPFPEHGISEETLQYHHGKHHAGYVAKLNKLIEGDEELQSRTLTELVKTTTGPIFNSAAQAWNHEFYWRSMTPTMAQYTEILPQGGLLDAVYMRWGTVAKMKEAFLEEATGHFGSGWVWLVSDSEGRLEWMQTHDGGNPLTEGRWPVLACDVWEHAYYIDYRNARPPYLQAWWDSIDWQFADDTYVQNPL